MLSVGLATELNDVGGDALMNVGSSETRVVRVATPSAELSGSNTGGASCVTTG